MGVTLTRTDFIGGEARATQIGHGRRNFFAALDVIRFFATEMIASDHALDKRGDIARLAFYQCVQRITGGDGRKDGRTAQQANEKTFHHYVDAENWVNGVDSTGMAGVRSDPSCLDLSF